MRIDLTCPAEIFRVELPTEALPAAGLLLYNLSDRVIASVEATITLKDEKGQEREKVVYRARALNGRPHSTFRMSVPCPAEPENRSADALIGKVWFADNAVWRRNPAAETEYEPNALPISPALTALKYAAGETAVGFPSQQDGLWVCVCGRPNPDRAEVCARCRQEKAFVFARFNREAVETQVSQRERQLELGTRSAREDTLRLQRIREAEYNRTKSRRARRIHIAILAAFALAVTAGAWFVGAPAVQLIEGRRAIEEGRFPEAEAILGHLGSFGDAEAQLAEARYRQARKTAEESRDPAELAAAAEALRAIPDREEAAAAADEAEIRAGNLLLAGGDREGAMAAAGRAREGAPGRETLRQDCLYTEATELLGNKEFEKARTIFLRLGSYGDAAEKASACVYEPTLQLIEDGLYDEAITALSGISGYQDSRELILKCHYLKGMMLERAGDPDGAAAEYLLAADWDDAKDKAMAMIYAQAEAALAAGDIAKAAPLYSAIPDYPGAKEKSRECYYALAEKSYGDTEYLRTLELLAEVPDDYRDTASLRKKSAFQAGSAALERGEWETAAGLLEQAGDEKGASGKLEAAREAWAGTLIEAGDLSRAEGVIQAMAEGEKRDSLMKHLTWTRLRGRLENGGDPEEILGELLALGDWPEARDTITGIYYRLGEEAAERKEALAAADLFEAAGDYPGAKEKAQEQYDAYYGERARAILEAMEQKEFALAVTLLESLNLEKLPESYAGLREMLPQARYEAGVALYDSGKIYEALPYFRAAAPENRRAANRLKAPCYLILGKWADREGRIQAEFREDGSCRIAGEEMLFRMPDSYSLETGKSAGEMANTIRVSDLTEGHLGLRDLRSDPPTLYSLTRSDGNAEDGAAANQAENPETNPEAGGSEDFTVADEE